MKITRAENYFKKNGFIYGDSYKYSFGWWEHSIKKFTDFDKALEWLESEEHDFRTRELISKTDAQKRMTKAGQW